MALIAAEARRNKGNAAGSISRMVRETVEKLEGKKVIDLKARDIQHHLSALDKHHSNYMTMFDFLLDKPPASAKSLEEYQETLESEDLIHQDTVMDLKSRLEDLLEIGQANDKRKAFEHSIKTWQSLGSNNLMHHKIP